MWEQLRCCEQYEEDVWVTLRACLSTLKQVWGASIWCWPGLPWQCKKQRKRVDYKVVKTLHLCSEWLDKEHRRSRLSTGFIRRLSLKFMQSVQVNGAALESPGHNLSTSNYKSGQFVRSAPIAWFHGICSKKVPEIYAERTGERFDAWMLKHSLPTSVCKIWRNARSLTPSYKLSGFKNSPVGTNAERTGERRISPWDNTFYLYLQILTKCYIT